jgi:tetratricopeptide (TPR) repeat protein
MRALLLLLLSFSLTTSVLADADSTFARANADYAAGKFSEAIKGYESIVASRQWAPGLFYNLGNAYYRTDDFGRAILNYERALALDPSQAEARANLQLARDRGRALELAPSWTEQHLDLLTRDQYAWLAAFAFWGAAAILCGLYFARRRAVVWIFAFILLGAIAVGAGFAIYELENGAAGSDVAIVTAKNTQARVATAESAGSVLALPPGSEIKILSTRGGWSFAQLPNDLQGWIPEKGAERVRL